MNQIFQAIGLEESLKESHRLSLFSEISMVANLMTATYAFVSKETLGALMWRFEGEVRQSKIGLTAMPVFQGRVILTAIVNHHSSEVYSWVLKAVLDIK